MGPRTLATLFAAAALAQGALPDEDPSPGATEASASSARALDVDWGGEHRLHFPVGERLIYRARVELSFLSASVGTVTMTTGSSPFRAPVVLPDGAAPGEEDRPQRVAWMRAWAYGDHLLYTLDTELESRIYPTDWPRIQYRYTSKGSEKRRREMTLGTKDGGQRSRYRWDTRAGAPKGQRIWAEPREREVPAAALDMLSAVYYARTLVLDDLDELVFPLMDKERIWQIRLVRGARALQEVEAGRFRTFEILLEPGPYPGEEIDAEKSERFKGLFGLEGSIKFWIEEQTGVPVRITGDVPAGPVTLGVDIQLEGFEGAPEGFAPLR